MRKALICVEATKTQVRLAAAALHLVILSSRSCYHAEAFVIPSSPITMRRSAHVIITRPRSHGTSSARPHSSALAAPATAAQNSPEESTGDDSTIVGPLGWIKSNKPADSKNRLTMGLAFLTGWSDVALVAKYRTFATMMTGNMMWLASAAINGRYGDVGYYASIILCYMLGLAGFRRAELTLKNKSLTFVCAPAVVALFCMADYLSYLNPTRRWPSMVMLGTAFGFINSVGTEMAGTLAFVLTGHMTRLTNLVVDRFSRTAGRKRVVDANASAALRSASVIAAFFGGALWAAAILRSWPKLLERGGNFAILGSLYGLLFLWQDRETLGAWWKRDEKDLCELDTYETTCS